MSAEFELVEPRSNDDFAELAALARRLAAYHGDAFDPSADVLRVDHGTWYRAILARAINGASIGYAGWHPIYSIQFAGRAIELQNLFVDPEWRRRQVGLALVRHVAVAALAAGADVLRIGVRKDNASAMAFYDQIGCTRLDRGANWVCRLDTAALQKLVA